MEKAFYPRNDMTNAVVSRLLPRDGDEKILKDWNDEEVYLEHSAVLDGTDVHGFGYVNNHPYKWRLEIETSVKSVAVVPDRFFSIYGKVYPIKRKQTIGINQPSESFKYEIIYLRGYDKYDDEGPRAKIIYHRQAEANISHEYICESDKEALKILDDFTGYPYLKLRVCLDGSIKAYLGKKEVGWDYTRDIADTGDNKDHAEENKYWVEMPQINTEQFRGIDLWLRFDSINALSYYILTKYEENVFSIGPKKITGGLSNLVDVFIATYQPDALGDTPYTITLKNGVTYGQRAAGQEEYVQEVTVGETAITINGGEFEVNAAGHVVVSAEILEDVNEDPDVRAQEDLLEDLKLVQTIVNPSQTILDSTTEYDFSMLTLNDIVSITPSATTTRIRETTGRMYEVDDVVGKDYELEDSEALTDHNSECVPCCKKANLSRSIWAYVNPKTMQPFDDDYWFHQGETYYKKSLTLSTKEAPLKAKKINITAGDFPGMYKIVGETYIRSRDDGKDERVQLTFPLCKIKSNQTLTLQADGDPTTFNLEVEVAVPQNGIGMEMTFYEIEKELKLGCNGNMIEKDGSTRIAAK